MFFGVGGVMLLDYTGLTRDAMGEDSVLALMGTEMPSMHADGKLLEQNKRRRRRSCSLACVLAILLAIGICA
jgi:hypothetical protein